MISIFDKAGAFLTTWGNIIAQTARASAKNSGSKRIPQSITVTNPKISLTSAEITIYADPKIAPHAAIFEKGAKNHPIDAKNAPNLVFWWDKMETMFVGKHVDHPGMKPRPFMSVAVRNHRKHMLHAARKEFGDIFRAIIQDNSYKV